MLQRLLVMGMVLCSVGMNTYSQSAWIVQEGEWVVTPSFTYQTYDSFWAKTTEVSPPPFADEVNQYTASITVEYGLMEDVALDITVGYTLAEVDGGTFSDNDGASDTLLGVRWKFLDEFETECVYAPTLTLRLGGIIAGSYEESMPHSPGDGASGGEISLLFGKAFGETGFGMFGDLGFRARTDDVPEDFFSSVGMYKTFLEDFTVSVGYRLNHGLNGLDIGGPGFSPARFPELQEINHNIETGISYTDSGNRTYSFLYAHTVDGENTAEKDVFSFAVSFAL
jgi:hypothetical protein